MNKFSGTLYYADSKPVPNANVIVTVNKTSIKESTVTDTNGKWDISLKEDVDPKDIKILFSKSGYQSKQVNGPIQTATLEGFIDPIKGGTLNLQSLFASGKYKVESLSGEDKEVLDHELEDLFQFIKKNQGNVQIKIRSSESKVTNADNEGTGKDFSQPGSLAKERGLTLQKYIEDELNKKINSDTSIQNPDNFKPIFNYTESDISRVGDQPWEKNNPDVAAENKVLVEQEGVDKSSNLSKYKKDQYVAVDVTLIEKVEECYANLIIDILYIGTKHGCYNATFKVLANDVTLMRDDGKDYVSLNNLAQEADIDTNKIAADIIDRTNRIAKYKAETDIKKRLEYIPLIRKLEATNVREEERLIRVKQRQDYDNVIQKYNIRGKKNDPSMSRFKKYNIGDTFELFNLTPPQVKGQSGHRYNRILIKSDLVKSLSKPGTPSIQITIQCDNLSGFNHHTHGTGCHKGIATIAIYKLKPDNTVKYIVPPIDFITPTTQLSTLNLFKFNPCTGEITDKNKDAFKSEEDIPVESETPRE
jgi:hypothetical protein